MNKYLLKSVVRDLGNTLQIQEIKSKLGIE